MVNAWSYVKKTHCAQTRLLHTLVLYPTRRLTWEKFISVGRHSLTSKSLENLQLLALYNSEVTSS